jgi:hypothetical protein
MVTLKGIGGKTQPLQKAGVLKVIKPDNRILKLLCYVFDEPVGNSDQLLLISMSAINKAKIDVQYHIEHSCEGRCKPLRFLNGNKDELLLADTLDYCENMKENCPVNLYQESILYEKLTSSLLIIKQGKYRNLKDEVDVFDDISQSGPSSSVSMF